MIFLRVTLQRATSHFKRKKTRKERNRHVTQFTFLLAVFLFFDSKFLPRGTLFSALPFIPQAVPSKPLAKKEKNVLAVDVCVNKSECGPHAQMSKIFLAVNQQSTVGAAAVRSQHFQCVGFTLRDTIEIFCVRKNCSISV